MNLKTVVKRLLGDRLLGAIDYYCLAGRRDGFGYKPFNNQSFRRLIFQELVSMHKPSTIVETGTYLGTTTAYMHEEAGVPVYTTEITSRCYGHVKARFIVNSNIHVFNLDSRTFLSRLARKPSLATAPTLFYLDAHWGQDLPLCEEVEIVFRHFQNPVVMIDDFKVPGDADYSYDDYGNGKALTLEYLANPIHELGLVPFFPTRLGAEEDGRRRGCVVFARSQELIEKMMQMKTLAVSRNS